MPLTDSMGFCGPSGDWRRSTGQNCAPIHPWGCCLPWGPPRNPFPFRRSWRRSPSSGRPKHPGHPRHVQRAYLPCFRFARRQCSSPSGVRGPVDMPPWFRQRVYRLLLTLQIADAWQGVPRRVFAPHRGAFIVRSFLWMDPMTRARAYCSGNSIECARLRFPPKPESFQINCFCRFAPFSHPVAMRPKRGPARIAGSRTGPPDRICCEPWRLASN
jgi:hypothetical protein